jgi:hypothetical protein
MASYALSDDVIRIEFIDATSQAPRVAATLEGSFDKGSIPLSFRGNLKIVRIDQPAAIFDWKVEQAVVIKQRP